MIVLSDTSPLNYLLLIGHADILPTIFGELFIPQAVADELAHPRAPEVVRHWIAAPPPWCHIRAATEVDAAIALGRGEREAICLALELHADLLLIDDRLARTYAESRGLRVAGTLNVLEAAAERQLLKLPEAVDRLRNTNFHVSQAIIDRALAADAARNK